MRLVKYWGLGLLAFLLIAEGLWHHHRVSADDDPKPEAPPAPVKEVLDKYLKALAAKDLKAMTALADVPWLDRDRQVVRNRTDLGKALERMATQLPKGEGQRKVETFPYKKMRDQIKDVAERKVLDEMLGEDGWLVTVEEDGYPLSLRTILIRGKVGKAAVVGGPLKQNQITPQNRIPEAVERLFDKAETFELYSLDPERRTDKEGKVVEVKDGFHGWQVLGKTEVKGEAERKRLVDALRLGAEDNFGMVAGCFIPRHGLRLKGGGKMVDLVICFQCLQVQVFGDGEKQKGFLTTGEPQKEFDATLKVAGVKLPKPAKD
jgi:hypothetical protein